MATLSPAEERGLHGFSLDSRVRQAFYTIPPAVLADLEQTVTQECFRRSIVYGRARACNDFSQGAQSEAKAEARTRVGL